MSSRTRAAVTSAVFFFNDTATTEIYTLSLHDALPIFLQPHRGYRVRLARSAHLLPMSDVIAERRNADPRAGPDRKSTRLNSSHGYISYAVFCLKKKKRRSSMRCERVRLRGERRQHCHH